MDGCQRDPLLCILSSHEEEKKKMDVTKEAGQSVRTPEANPVPVHVRFRSDTPGLVPTYRAMYLRNYLPRSPLAWILLLKG